jgi:hypothetical protein
MVKILEGYVHISESGIIGAAGLKSVTEHLIFAEEDLETARLELIDNNRLGHHRSVFDAASAVEHALRYLVCRGLGRAYVLGSVSWLYHQALIIYSNLPHCDISLLNGLREDCYEIAETALQAASRLVEFAQEEHIKNPFPRTD